MIFAFTYLRHMSFNKHLTFLIIMLCYSCTCHFVAGYGYQMPAPGYPPQPGAPLPYTAVPVNPDTSKY